MKILNIINNKNFIDGQWISSVNKIAVTNPSTNQVIGYAPDLPQEEITRAIDAASRSFKHWSQTNFAQRIAILKKWQQLINDNINELADILTLEQGKTLKDAKSEIMYGVSFVEWFVDVLNNVQGSIKSGINKNHKIITEYEPVGPVAAITPWNFPCAMVTRKVTPAIAAGCTVVLKPSEFTPFSALILAKLATDAGLPDGVLNIVTGDAELIGKVLCADFRIRKLSFTGSTRVGKILYQNCHETLKRLSLELGGNAPFIVFADCNVDKVIEDLLTVKLRSSGQSCTSPNRVFIHKDIYEIFKQKFAFKFSTLKSGDGFDDDSDVGPLINKAAIDKIISLIQDAVTKGAKILCGGKANENFMEPTIIADCQDNMAIFSNEIFGPVVALYQFDNEEEVINRANATEYGLQAYLYSKDLSRAHKLTAALDFGMVSINSTSPFNCKATFAGRKASGFGVEGGDEGIFEYLNTKYINLNIV